MTKKVTAVRETPPIGRLMKKHQRCVKVMGDKQVNEGVKGLPK